MSTLRCTNLQDTAGGNSLTTAQIYNGTAKAWVNFNGTGTVAIRAQFNVSSITDNGTGQYTVNFSSSMSDANYAAVGMGGDIQNIRPYIVDAYSYSSGSLAMASHLVDSSGPGFYWDHANISIAIFR